MSLELFAGLSLGASLGLVSGILVARKLGLTPHAKELSKALDENESYYKTMLSRLKGRLKEYEQPSDLQRLAQSTNGAEDPVKMLLGNLGNIQGIPKWIRPFIPGIQAYAAEHPEQVQELIQKFIKQGGRGSPDQEPDGDML